MTILNLAITDSADDGTDIGAQWLAYDNDYVESNFFEIKKTPSTTKLGGVRFRNITVPNGATINSATLTLTNKTAASAVDSITIWGDDVDDAPLWSAGSRPNSGFTDTTASGVQNTVPITAGSAITIDVTSVVQELVDRGGWVSGNSQRFRVLLGATYRVMKISDYQVTPDDTTADVAQLDIDYTAGASAPVLSLPTEASITDTTATLGCTTDDATGTLYYFVSTSATAPSAAALKAGTGSDDFGSDATLSAGINTFASTGLTASQTYYTYFIQNDGASDSNILESGSGQLLRGPHYP